MQGKIIKAIAGFYYVHDGKQKIYECRAKGLFRLDGSKPLVGDDVIFFPVEDTEKPDSGSIREILPRKSALIRPAAANVDQALIVFSCHHPEFHPNLLDRFLLRMALLEIPCVIVFGKTDLTTPEEQEELSRIYAGSGCPVIHLSASEGIGVDRLWTVLAGKTSVLAGPSGVGKSTLLNALAPEASAQTGDVSRKIGRGRHTTRHTELFNIGEDTYLLDTPGFSSLDPEQIEPEQLRYYYPEFSRFEGRCRFDGCLHDKEPGCAVKEAVAAGQIHPKRHESYRLLLEELRGRRRY